jgi:hypothetical protein
VADQELVDKYAPKLPQQLRDQVAEVEAYIAAQQQPEGEGEGEGGEGEGDEGGEDQRPLELTPQALLQQPPPGDDQTWEQRYKSLLGRLDQATRINQTLGDRVSELEGTIHSIRAGTPPASPPATPGPVKLLSDTERNEYGDEFFTVVGKRAQELFTPEMEQLASRLKQIESRVDATGQLVNKSQTMDVYATLADAIPQWREINRSVEFKQWLQYPDMLSGRKRQDMLKEAFDLHDANRVLAFFSGFVTEATGLPRTPPGNGAAAPPLASPGNGQGNGSGRPTLEQYAAPGRGTRSGLPQTPPDKPVYTQAWIAQFSAAKIAGKFKGREAEVEQIDRDIFAAQHEGRIQ